MVDDQRLYRRRDVERITTLSRSSIYRLIEDGSFPRPVKVGKRDNAWTGRALNEWLGAIAGSDGK